MGRAGSGGARLPGAALGLAACLGLGACGAGCGAGLTRQPGADLYFGGSLGEAAWRAFAADTLGPAFPSGFTVFDAAGQWRDPRSGAVVLERTRVVQAFGPEVPGHLAAVTEAYRARFHQVSVGVVSRQVCAAF